jgi:hypothetical protein
MFDGCDLVFVADSRFGAKQGGFFSPDWGVDTGGQSPCRSRTGANRNSQNRAPRICSGC